MAALRILGPLRLRGLAGDAELGGDKPRRLLAVLALYANEPVSGDFLTEAIWGGSPPRSARENLQTYIWGLRRAIRKAGAAGLAIDAAPQGYLLRIDPDELDWLRFTRAVSAARDSCAHDPAAAAKLLREALGYWRGQVLGGLADDLVLVRPRLAAMGEARLSAVEQCLRAELAVGRHQELLTELAELTGDYPLREQFRALRMIALYRSGRQAEALAVYHDLRALLSAELGIEPAPEVRRLHESILRADPSLNGPAARAPVAQSAVRVPHQLPPPASQFTGRTSELVRLEHLASAVSSAAVLIVVTGSPGVGKTALALNWAHSAQDRFSDGTFFADLRGFDPGNPPAEPAEVLDGFFRAMGLAPQDIPAAVAERSALLRTALTGKRALLVLDNAASAAQVRPLLPGGPGCLVLVTSRSRLSGLAVREGAVRIELPPLPPADAVALLARVVGEPVAAEPVAAAQVAKLCGGLPLALRVAAERATGAAGLTGLVAGLADERNRLSVLTTDDDDVAVRAAFGASYRLLDQQSARMFTLCGLQPTREFSASAAAAALGEPEKVASRLLGKLAGAHLVETAANGRMMLHDLLAVYASELADGPERTATVRRLLDWYLYTADAADRQLIPRRARPELPARPASCCPLSFAGYAEAFAWCESERANLAAASRQALAAGELEIAWRLPAAITAYLQISRRWDDWLSTHETGIDAAKRLADTDALAWLLGSLGRAHGDLQDYARSRQCFAEALAIRVASGDLHGQAALQLNLGFLHWKQSQLEEGIACFERSLTLFRQLGDLYGEAMALNNLGEAHQQLGRYATAVGRLRQALEVFRQTDDMYNQAMVLDSLGNCERMRGQPGQALPFFDEALVLRRRTGDRQGEAVTLSNLAEAYQSAGRVADARRSWRRALAILDELGDPEAGRIRRLLADSQPLYLFCSGSLDAPRTDGRHAATGVTKEPLMSFHLPGTKAALFRLSVLIACLATAALSLVLAPPAHAGPGGQLNSVARPQPTTRTSPVGRAAPGARNPRLRVRQARSSDAGQPTVSPAARAELAKIPRRLYDPVGSDGVAQHVLLGTAADLTGRTPKAAFAGVTLDTRAGVVNLYLSSTSASARAAAMSAIPAADRHLVRVHAVPLSQATLSAGMRYATRVIDRLLRQGIDVRSWWPDFIRGRIDVAVYRARPGQVGAVAHALRAFPVAVSTTTAAVAPLNRLAGRGLTAAAEPACPANMTSGVSSACDASPLSGGDFVQYPVDSSHVGDCTDSWPIMTASAYYMLTAGHCSTFSNGVAAAGKSFINEGGDGANGFFGDDVTIGTSSADSLDTTSASVDAQVIPTQPGITILPRIWTGSTAGNAAMSTPLPVLGGQTPPSGTSICNGGGYEGTVCGAIVQQSGYGGCQTSTDSPGTQFCSTYQAQYSGSQEFSGEGDSGGPLYTMSSTGVTAAGLDSLGTSADSCTNFTGRGNVCSNTMYFTGISAILTKFGASMLPPVLDLTNQGQFGAEWNALASANGSLGEPVTAWSAGNGGQQQIFQGGGIFWSSATGTHGIYGAAYSEFSGMGGTSSVLGFPASEQLSPAGGAEWEFAGTSCTAPDSPNGSGSAILTQNIVSGPAREVQGCIYQSYLNSNGPSGPYGFPTSDEEGVYSGSTQIGRVNYFAGSAVPSCSTGSEPGGGTTAAIYWNSAAGSTHGVNGCIFAEYHSVGEASGSLGFPIDDAHSVNGKNVQDFQNGTISGSNGSYSVSTGTWVPGAAVNTANDYPYETFGQFEHQNQGTDAWNEYYGQCDSFAAWKVYQLLAGSTAQHPNIPVPAVGWKPGNAGVGPVNQNTWGNADNWGKMASSEHWAVNNVPAPGTIAWWNNSSADSAHGIGSDGHVGYVTAVYPDGSVTIASYNLRLNGEFSLIHLPYNGSATDTSFHMGGFTVPWPSGFIHVADGIDPNATLPAEPANGTVSFGYPTQVKVVGPGSPSAEYSLGNVWYSDPGHGEIGAEEYTHTNGASAVSTATYTPSGLAANACYQVDAFVPDNYSDNPVAVYTVTDVNGTHMAAVNENVYTNDWADLGVYKANGSGGLTVRLDDRGTTGLYVSADAMRFWAVSCAKYADVAPIMRQSTISNAWIGDSGHGFFGAMQYTSTTGSLTADSTSASWAATGLLPGTCYEVSAYVPDNFSDNNAARYETVDNYWGVFWPQINENAFTNAFAPLGTFVANSSGQITLALTNIGPSGQYVAADAAAFTPDPGCSGPAGTGIGWTYPSDVLGPGSAPGPFVTTNQWYSRLGHGYANHELWTYDNGSTADSTATWTFTGSANTCYSVAAYIPDNFADNPQARYSVGTSTEGVSLTLSQQGFTNAFAHLAAVHTGSNGAVTVHLDDTGPAKDSAGNPLYTAADAVEFVANGQGC